MPNLDPKLLAEIVERPLDDASRLVLADALQEKGDPRGQFIVAQCRLAERGVPRDERNALKREVAQLASQNAKAWAGPAMTLTSFELRRGFVDEVRSSAANLAPVCAELFSTQPITRLTIDGASADTLAPLASAGAFAHVVQLKIVGSIGDPGAEVLAHALGRRKMPLQSLNVGANGISAKGALAIANALAGCRSLALTSNSVGDDGVAALARAKPLASLEVLYLTANDITDDGLPALAASTCLGSLVRIGLARNEEITADGLALVARSKKLKRLRWLEYTDDDGLQAIAVRGR